MNQNIIVDIKNPNITPPPIVIVKQGDSKSRVVIATICDNGVVQSALNAPCQVYFGGGKNTVFIDDLTILNGLLTFTIPQNAIKKVGKTKAEIRILTHIECSNSRPALFTYKDKLYLLFNGYNRRKMYICTFANNKWVIIAESDIHNIYPSVVTVDDEIYMTSTQNSSMCVYLSIVSHSILDNKPMDIINILNNAFKLTDIIKK